MDLSSLQSLQSLQLAAGLMAFPPHTDPKQTAANTASMLPLMLPTMGGLPNMFSLGGLFGGNLAAAATTSSNSVAAGNRNGTMEAEGGNGEEALLAKRKREEEEEKGEGENGDEVGEDEEEAEGNEEGVTKAKKRKMEDGGAAPRLPGVDSSAGVSINGDAAALLAAAGMSANSLAFNPFLLSTMAPGLLYPSMFLPPGLAGLSLSGFPTASTLAELQSAMAGAMGDSTPTPNPPRDEEEDTREGVKSTEEEEEEGDEGAERDLAEDDGGAEGGATGAFEHPALDKGGVEEEAAVSPKKTD